MLSWFKRSEKFYGDFAFLGVDVHSHLIPGIDDGSASVEDSVRFVEGLRALGWKGLIATPHVMGDLYPNTIDTISAPFASLGAALPSDVFFRHAAEYMTDEYFEGLMKGEDRLMTFGSDQVLIEMSYLAESPRIREYIFDLRVRNYQPVLAHPERYNFYHRRYDRLIELRDMGCQFQLNLLSLSGYYGSSVRGMAERLLAARMYDYAGTDLHHDKHLAALEAMTKMKVMKTLESYGFKNSALG